MPDSIKERALLQAMERHRHRIYRLAYACLRRHADAEDILQEVFIKYYRSAPEFESDEHEKAWLLRVTTNTCISLLRSPWRRITGPIPESMPAPEPTDDGSWLISLVHRLPARYAAVIHLHYYEDLSVREISSILRVPEGTVKSRLSRARSLLEDMIKKEESIHGQDNVQTRL